MSAKIIITGFTILLVTYFISVYLNYLELKLENDIKIQSFKEETERTKAIIKGFSENCNYIIDDKLEIPNG